MSNEPDQFGAYKCLQVNNPRFQHSPQLQQPQPLQTPREQYPTINYYNLYPNSYPTIKLNYPVFSNEEKVTYWLRKVEQYFKDHQIEEKFWVDFCSFYLNNEPMQWYIWYTKNVQNHRSLQVFKEEIIVRFNHEEMERPYDALTRSVSSYVQDLQQVKIQTAVIPQPPLVYHQELLLPNLCTANSSISSEDSHDLGFKGAGDLNDAEANEEIEQDIDLLASENTKDFTFDSLNEATKTEAAHASNSPKSFIQPSLQQTGPRIPVTPSINHLPFLQEHDQRLCDKDPGVMGAILCSLFDLSIANMNSYKVWSSVLSTFSNKLLKGDFHKPMTTIKCLLHSFR